MTLLINCKTCGSDIKIAPRPDLVARRSSPSPPPPPRDWADRPPGSRSWLSLLNPGWENIAFNMFHIFVTKMPAYIAATYSGYFVKFLPFLPRFPWSDSALRPFLKQFWPSENWKGAAAQGFVYQIGASGFFLKQLDRLGTLTPIVKPLTTKSSFGLTSSWGTGACFGSEDHELKWHHPWQTQTEWHLYLQKKMNFYETSTRNNIAVNNESIS